MSGLPRRSGLMGGRAIGPKHAPADPGPAKARRTPPGDAYLKCRWISLRRRRLDARPWNEEWQGRREPGSHPSTRGADSGEHAGLGPSTAVPSRRLEVSEHSSVVSQEPGSLALAADRHALTGDVCAEPAAGKFTFTVTDSASPPVSKSIELTLEIKPESK